MSVSGGPDDVDGKIREYERSVYLAREVGGDPLPKPARAKPVGQPVSFVQPQPAHSGT